MRGDDFPSSPFTYMLLRAPLYATATECSSTQHRLQCVCVHDPQNFKNSSNSIESNAQLFCKNHLHSVHRVSILAIFILFTGKSLIQYVKFVIE